MVVYGIGLFLLVHCLIWIYCIEVLPLTFVLPSQASVRFPLVMGGVGIVSLVCYLLWIWLYMVLVLFYWLLLDVGGLCGNCG